jgi:hypothetical protein
MEIILFLAVAIGLYFVADRLLDRIEVARGARLEHRTLVFFGILLALALITFTVLDHVLN